MNIVIKSKDELAGVRLELAKALEGESGDLVSVADIKQAGFLKTASDAQIHAAAEQLGYAVQL